MSMATRTTTQSPALINETYSAFVQGFMPTLTRLGGQRARLTLAGRELEPALLTLARWAERHLLGAPASSQG
jgi:hypothetical protein